MRGDVRRDEPVLVRVHSECLTGDVFGSRRCDCGAQLADALDAIDEAGRGVLVYLRGHEGRGIGIASKLDAYRLQDGGHDTVDANLHLGLPVDSREYGTGAQILAALGVERMRLITNNPAKCEELDGYGIEVEERVALPTAPDAREHRLPRDQAPPHGAPARRSETPAARTTKRRDERPRVQDRRGHRVIEREQSTTPIRKAVAKAASRCASSSGSRSRGVRGHLHDGAVAHCQVTVKIGFRLED